MDYSKTKYKPQENTLSEFEKVIAEQYFENIQFILTSFWISEVSDKINNTIQDTKLYYLNGDGVKCKSKYFTDGSLNIHQRVPFARIRETDSF